MKRHEVTDEQWDVIQLILPKRTAKTGRPPSDSRSMLNGILWILRTGSPWRDLPERFGPWQTVYDHFAKWPAMGAYDRILEAPHIRLDADGTIDCDLWCIDGSSVRASRAAAGEAAQATEAIGGRQRLQLPPCARLAPEVRNQTVDTAKGKRETEERRPIRLRQAGLQASQHRRADDRLAEGMQTDRHEVRTTRHQLPRYDEACDDPTVPQNGVLRQSLASGGRQQSFGASWQTREGGRSLVTARSCPLRFRDDASRQPKQRGVQEAVQAQLVSMDSPVDGRCTTACRSMGIP